MAANQHQQFVELAQRLIPRNGRTISIVIEPDSQADASRPWEGPADDTGKQVLATTTTPLKALFTDFTKADANVFRIQLGDTKVLIPAGDLGFALTTSHQIRDGAIDYSIEDFKLIKPGDTAILYIVQART